METDDQLKSQAANRAQHDLTDRQRDVLDFYRTFHERTGFWPTVREVMAGMGFKSPEAVVGHVGRLVKKGWMTQGPKGSARTVAVVPDPGDNCCPTCGRMFEIRKSRRGVQ